MSPKLIATNFICACRQYLTVIGDYDGEMLAVERICMPAIRFASKTTIAPNWLFMRIKCNVCKSTLSTSVATRFFRVFLNHLLGVHTCRPMSFATCAAATWLI